MVDPPFPISDGIAFPGGKGFAGEPGDMNLFSKKDIKGG
jgi:hypothetical protein